MGIDVGVLLLDGPGLRLLGSSVHARNRRVAERVSARVIAVGELPHEHVRNVLVVPDTTAIERSLFEQLPVVSDVRELRTESGAWVVFGPEAEVRRILHVEKDRVRLDRSRPIAVAAVSEASLNDVASYAARNRSERAMLKRCEKSTDGFVSRHLNRPMSRFFSYWFLKAGLSPAFASAINLLIGFGSAWFAAQPGFLTMVIAGFLFQFASMFDGVDGEMARSTLSESKRGAAIDTAVDNLTYVACLVGVTVGWIREGVGPFGYGIAAVVLVAVPVTLLQVISFVRRYGPDASLVFFDRSVRRAAEDSGSAVLRVVAALFSALRRDLFAFIFFIVSFAGRRTVVPALIVLGLLIANYALLFHRKRLVKAALHLCPPPTLPTDVRASGDSSALAESPADTKLAV